MHPQSKPLIAAVLMLAILPHSCEERKSQLGGLTETLGYAMSALIRATGNASLADTLTLHTQTAVAIIRGWNPGSSPADAFRALNRLIDDLNLLPQEGAFRPLVMLALGTIAAIMEALQEAGQQPAQINTPIRCTVPPHTSSEFKEDWNRIRAGSPGMQQAPVL